MERLSVAGLIAGTMETLQAKAEAVALYVVGLSVLGTLLEWGIGALVADGDPLVALPDSVMSLLGVGAGLGGLAVLVVSIIAQYLLWEAMLDNGLPNRDGAGEAAPRRRYLAFVGLSILVGFGSSLAFLALIVPGLICIARWSAAPAFLIKQRQGVIEAMGSSWYMVKGQTTPVVLTYLVGMLVFMVLAAMIGGAGAATVGLNGGMGVGGLFASLAGQLVSHVGTVLQVGLGVFVFRALTGGVDEIGAVFD